MKPRCSTIEPPGIRDLLSYRLHVVAHLLSRGAELRYGREADKRMRAFRKP